MVTPEQYAFLTGELDPKRVRQLKGQSHMEAWDIRRTLIRTFGFGGFDIETKSLDLVAQIQHTHDKDGREIPAHKPRWTVIYRAEIRLSVKDAAGNVIAFYEDAASGDSQNQPSLGDAHDQAMKTAVSQGLKRCAVNLGDQFGLSLYNGGRTDRVVHRTLSAPEANAQPAEMPVEQVHPEQSAASEPEPQPGSPAADVPAEISRAAALADAIAACTTRDQLAAVWKDMVAAGKKGDVLPRSAEVLKNQWKARDARIKTIARLFALLNQAEIVERDHRISWYVQIIGREVDSTNDLAQEELDKICAKTEAWIRQEDPVGAGAGR